MLVDWQFGYQVKEAFWYEEHPFEWYCEFSVFTMFCSLSPICFILGWLKSMWVWKISVLLWLDYEETPNKK